MSADRRGTLVARAHGRASLFVGLLAALLFSAPVAGAGWSGPGLVGRGGDCLQPQAAIDEDGGFHVAAACGSGVTYWTKSGSSWSTTRLGRPTSAIDSGPQITIDGRTLYVAFSRNPAEGCGADLDAGVYYRTRTLPDGSWSPARFIGKLQDRLQSFRVVGGSVHATITSIEGEAIYETTASGVLKRYAIPGATGLSSLRIGSDGRARIAYEAEDSLRYAAFAGSRLASSAIPGTLGRDGYPVLVLDAGNHAHLVWERMTRRPMTRGCSDIDPPPDPPDNGTYYVTNASGAWTPSAARRITSNVGTASLTLDVVSGRVHVLLGISNGGVRYYTKTATGSWSGEWLSSARSSGVAIRLDQPRARLLAVYARFGAASNGIYALTKP